MIRDLNEVQDDISRKKRVIEEMLYICAGFTI